MLGRLVLLEVILAAVLVNLAPPVEAMGGGHPATRVTLGERSGTPFP
jgi:hypothetical protein